MLLAHAVDFARRLRRKQPGWLSELGAADTDAKSWVYLLTFARVLHERLNRGGLKDVATLTKQDVLSFVRDAWDNPISGVEGGRPRSEADGPLLLKVVVFEEKHQDGTKHFHVAVLLSKQMRFAPCKRTLLERHGLVAHFSCTHSQWWSAVRYGALPSARKQTVDDDPERWVPEGHTPIDLFQDSQEPFIASAWRRRRERKDCEAAVAGQTNAFSKLDFTSLVLSKGLTTRAAVLSYVRQHGTVAMQSYVNNNQRRLDEYLDDAIEWDSSDAVAFEEQQTDWAYVCSRAEQPCPLGEECPYHVAAQKFFEGNVANFSQADLAEALRRIIVMGPCKEARVPFLVGPTNTGKSSLVASFDSLFGARRVYHLPAVTDDKYPLRNWLRNKRFVLWDEFSPVEYATFGVLPVTQFKKAFNGQWFETRLPQGHHDGNQDFRWKRGVVFTNKLEHLWTPTRKVSPEDIKHLKSRCRLFPCTAVFVEPGTSKPEIPECANHLAKWLCIGAANYDAQMVVGGNVPVPRDGRVEGLEDLLLAASLPEPIASEVKREVEASGALHIREFTGEDWAALAVWPRLREMEERRFRRALGLG